MAAEVRELGREAYAKVTDITDSASCSALADFLSRTMGGVDALVTNAAHRGGESDLLDGNLGELRHALDADRYIQIGRTRGKGLSSMAHFKLTTAGIETYANVFIDD